MKKAYRKFIAELGTAGLTPDLAQQVGKNGEGLAHEIVRLIQKNNGKKPGTGATHHHRHRGAGHETRREMNRQQGFLTGQVL